MKVIELLPLESSIDYAFDEENRSAYDLFTTEQPTRVEVNIIKAYSSKKLYVEHE